MDYTKLFYWLTVVDNAKGFFITMIVIFTLISIISAIINVKTSSDPDPDEYDLKTKEISKKWMWRTIPFAILFWLLFIFTPNKKDALLIIAGGQTLNFLTTDEFAKEIPSELNSFILTEIKNIAKDAEVDLNIKETKNKILEEAKTMTAKEILEKAKEDSNFKKIILEE